MYVDAEKETASRAACQLLTFYFQPYEDKYTHAVETMMAETYIQRWRLVKFWSSV